MKREQIVAQDEEQAIRGGGDRHIERTNVNVPERMLPAMPIRVLYDPMEIVVSTERQGDDFLFRFRFAHREGNEDNRIEATTLRETFLEIKTPGEALNFLTLAGRFRGLDENGEYQESMTWSDFQKWQEIIRIVLVHGILPMKELSSTPARVVIGFDVPDHLKSVLSDLSMKEQGWLQGFPEQLVIRADEPVKGDKRKKLCAEVFVNSVLEAILATAYIDELRGINYQLCALPDCPKIYEVSSKHERQYCSQACAHKASVRKRRAEEKAARDAAKARAAGIKAKKGRK
jgi:hypothetical protein